MEENESETVPQDEPLPDPPGYEPLPPVIGAPDPITPGAPGGGE